MNYLKQLTILSILFSLFLINTGCDIADSEENTPNSVAVKMRLVNNSQLAPKANNGVKIQAIDELTEIKLLVEELELESAFDDDSLDYEVENLVVNLPVDGSEFELASATIPVGTYDDFEIEIENDDADNIDDPDFRDGDEEYSIIIRGIFNGEEFTYRSEEDFEIEMDLNPPLEVNETRSSLAVAININPNGWFTDHSGNPLDPNDPSNQDTIDENIENSFEAELDDDDDD